jgi:hypothetical protein
MTSTPESPEPAGESTAQLEAELSATRARVASDVEELAERLRPEHIKRQLESSARLQLRRAWSALLLRPYMTLAVVSVGVALVVWRVRAHD